jgi:ubiquinone/menaquinone biosynthesis C-methylase UbiE
MIRGAPDAAGPEAAGIVCAVSRVRAIAYSLIVPAVRALNAALRALTSATHHLQYKVEGFLRPSAEWFDHEIDVQWQWAARQSSMFLERGVLNTLAMPPEGEVLELCCGDGFNAHRFYSGRAGHVLAVDNSEQALRHARRLHRRPNVSYSRCDISRGLPEGSFDNVIWDSAIHHFSETEVRTILGFVHGALRPGGVLSGYTIIEPGADYAYARIAFSKPEDLAELLAHEFPYVAVLQTPDALRQNLYFFASDTSDSLPFGPGVRHGPSAVHAP